MATLKWRTAGDTGPVNGKEEEKNVKESVKAPQKRLSLRANFSWTFAGNVVNAGSWFAKEFAGESIPCLKEVLNTFGGQLRLNLELKDFRAGMAVLELLAQYPSAEIVVSSFNYDLLRRLRFADGHLPLAVLFESGNWRHAVKTARDLSACAFHPAVNLVTRPMLAACTLAGLPVFVWTVDHACAARSLVRAGVSGLFTNDPATLSTVFQSPEFLT